MRVRRFEERWGQIVAASLLPPVSPAAQDSAPRPGGFDYGPLLRAQLREAPWWAAITLRLSIWLLWFSPLFTRGQARTFGAVPEAEREALLEETLSHRSYLLRECAGMFKLFACLAYLGEEPVLRRLGAYDLHARPRRLPEARP
jgi:hypothetical protein